MSTIMVVEDNRIIRAMYATGLSGYGYEVVEAASIAEAKSLLRSTPSPDAILLDLRLPDGSGRELIHYVRVEMQRSDIRLIVATGTVARRDDIVSLGADLLFVKPIELRELLDRIHACTG